MCYWFNTFWYGSLIEFLKNKDLKVQVGNELELSEAICIPKNSTLIEGNHYFPNLYPLNLINRTKNVISWGASGQRNGKGMREHARILSVVKDGYKRAPITDSGIEFLRNYYCNSSETLSIPPELLEEIEEETGFTFPFHSTPSLEFYIGYRERDLLDEIGTVNPKTVYKTLCP